MKTQTESGQAWMWLYGVTALLEVPVMVARYVAVLIVAAMALAVRQWFVLDEAQPHAEVRGDTLMVSRGALESEYLPALLAHELGHLRGMDARLMAAAERLEILPQGLTQPRTNAHEEATAGTSTPRQRKSSSRKAGLKWMAASGAARLLGTLLRGGFGLRL